MAEVAAITFTHMCGHFGTAYGKDHAHATAHADSIKETPCRACLTAQLAERDARIAALTIELEKQNIGNAAMRSQLGRLADEMPETPEIECYGCKGTHLATRRGIDKHSGCLDALDEKWAQQQAQLAERDTAIIHLRAAISAAMGKMIVVQDNDPTDAIEAVINVLARYNGDPADSATVCNRCTGSGEVIKLENGDYIYPACPDCKGMGVVMSGEKGTA